MNNCFGFIDGTVRPKGKAGQNQGIVYNGHKRVHCVKFQSMALPNGIIGNMYGPIRKEMEKCMVQTQANDVALKHHTFDNRRKPSTFLF